MLVPYKEKGIKELEEKRRKTHKNIHLLIKYFSILLFLGKNISILNNNAFVSDDSSKTFF